MDDPYVFFAVFSWVYLAMLFGGTWMTSHQTHGFIKNDLKRLTAKVEEHLYPTDRDHLHVQRAEIKYLKNDIDRLTKKCHELEMKQISQPKREPRRIDTVELPKENNG